MAEELFGGQDVGATPSYKEQAYRLIKGGDPLQPVSGRGHLLPGRHLQGAGHQPNPGAGGSAGAPEGRLCLLLPGQGVQVVPVSDRDARDILETRMYIECINAKLAANRAAQRDLQAMRESLDRLRDQLSTRDGQHLYRLDHIFHRAVAAATQNRLLYRECELLLDHYLRFEVKSVYNNSIDAKIVFDEHVAICDAIAEGSAERAEQAMARHLTNSYRRTVSRFWAE